MKVCRVCGVDISHRVGNIKTCEEHKDMILDICTICGKHFIKQIANHRHICYECRNIPKICPVCGKVYTLKGTSWFKDTCSEKCHKRKKYLESWDGGHYTGKSISSDKGSALSHAQIEARRIMWEVLKEPRECRVCHSTEKVEVHHRDENPFNNDPANLDRLCDRCHIEEHVRRRKARKQTAEVKPHSYR
jgi:endogenous inhibitor of DNA gyrase (YacG/DUF329 family)